uniref:Uncharacterized protein n=1 Tax=Rhizophora mucronata TaxID=61149 RepID=A0A2P2Q6G2_RHIMU
MLLLPDQAVCHCYSTLIQKLAKFTRRLGCMINTFSLA